MSMGTGRGHPGLLEARQCCRLPKEQQLQISPIRSEAGPGQKQARFNQPCPAEEEALPEASRTDVWLGRWARAIECHHSRLAPNQIYSAVWRSCGSFGL